MVDPLPPPPAKKGGLFGSKPAPAPMAAKPNEEMAAIARRLRLLEERYSRIENNLRNIEDNMNSMSRDFNRALTRIKSDVEGSNGQIEQMQERILMFIKELDLVAKQEDLDVIKKYLKYWDPVKFVQAQHVEKIVKDVLSDVGLTQRM